MRNNQPVTQSNIPVKETAHLITTTDLQSKITFVNDDFANIAGFAKEELLGQPHNIIRHPDMPSSAFEDLWNTIKSGHSWKGIVKNRCKNGDHYWVDAYVTPIYHNGQVVEYQSVRVAPSEAQISRAERVYKHWREGALPLFLRMPQLGLRTWISALLVIPFLLMTWELNITNIKGLVLIGSGYLVAVILVNIVLAPLVRASNANIGSRVMTWIYTGRQDEIGRLQYARMLATSELRAMSARMTDTCQSLQSIGSNTQTMTKETNQELNEQKDLLLENATGIEELSQTVSEVANRAQQTSEASGRSVTQTESGRDLVERMAHSIQSLAEQLEGAKQRIDLLADRSKEIGSVIDVINAVAEQTNLLALNAAIEAARAGDAGRGFAVVADEVRALATRTHQSTNQIGDIINNLQSDIAVAVDAVDSSATSLGESVSLTEEVRESLRQIVTEIQDIAGYMADVASASEQQSAVTEQLAKQTHKASELAEGSVRSGGEVHAAMTRLSESVGSVYMLSSHFLKTSMNSFAKK